MNLLRTLQKKASAKAISMILVVAMVLGALPASPAIVADAAGEKTNLTLHLMVKDEQNFDTPALNFWDGGDYTVSGNDGMIKPKDWEKQIYKLKKGVSANGVTDYSISIKGNIPGIQFLDVNTKDGNQARYQADVWNNAMNAFTEETPTDLYAVYNASGNTYTWYTNAACTTKLELATPANFTLHYLNKSSDKDLGVNIWGTDVTVTGTDGKVNKPTDWHDEAQLDKLKKEATDPYNGFNWYSATFNGVFQGIQITGAKSVIIEISGDKNSELLAQLNAKTGDSPKDVYLVGTTLYDSIGDILDEPQSNATSTDLTIHFQNSGNWEKVYARFGDSSWQPIAGYEYCMPSGAVAGLLEENSKNSGWYSFNVKKDDTETVNGQFTNGAWKSDGGEQAGDFSVQITENKMEAWMTIKGTGEITVSYTKPDGWVEGEAVGKPINPTESVERDYDSPVIEAGGKVTFNYKREKDDTSTEVYLMGTLTDWDNGKKMTYDAEKDLFTITLTLKPGVYQYKFKTSKAWYTDPCNNEYESGNSKIKVPGLALEGEHVAGMGPVTVTADVPSDMTVSENDLTWAITAVSQNAVDIAKIHINSNGDGKSANVTADKDAGNGYFKVRLTYGTGEDDYSELELYHTKKAYLYEYEYKENSQYAGKTDIYAWYNSAVGGDYDLKAVNGKQIAYITLDDTAESFGYIARLGGKWEASELDDREYGDRTLYVNADDLYTKVKGGEGIEMPYQLPSGKTTLKNGICFAYRDDELFYQNKMDTIANKAVKVLYKAEGASDYTELPMTYNAKDELFTATVSANGLEEGKYEFKFNVDGTVVADQYMGGTIDFKKPVFEIDAEVTPDKADYDMNPLVSLTIKDQATNEAVSGNMISEITADLSALGYEGVKTSFSKANFKGVLYINRNVKAGKYKVPVTVTDAWGNDHATEVEVEVVERTDASASWDESTVYFLLTDRFYDGDESNNSDVDKTMAEAYRGGDFKGLTSKLDYIQNLGVNTIWITPIVDNIEDIMNESLHQQAYHGYWAKDFTKIDEHLGTTEDFDTLIDEAAKRGIRIMVDIVINHAGYNTNDSKNFAGMLRENAVTTEQDVIRGELDNLPDFITENPEVRTQLVEWQTAWANHTTANGNKVSYFRVDTVKHVDHETWQELKASIAKDNPTFKMIGEYYGASVTNTGAYLGNGQMDAELDFDFKKMAGYFINGKLDYAENQLETRNERTSSSMTMGQFLGSHDEDGFLVTRAGNDLGKMKVAAALQLTAKGIPVIYYGEEVNLTGPAGSEGFGLFENNRYDMQFDNLTADQEAMLAHYQRLLAARNLYQDVFAAGSREKVKGSDQDGYMIFKRSYQGEDVYVALNTKDSDVEVTFSISGNEVLYNAYSGDKVDVTGNEVTVTIPSKDNGGTVILGAKSAVSALTVDASKSKTAYTVGDDLDFSNLDVIATYGTQTVKIPANDYTLDTSKYNKDAAGTYEISVSYAGITKTFNVQVTRKAEPPAEEQKPQQQDQQPQPQTPAQQTTVEVTGITLSETSATLEKGKTLTLTATVVPAEATDKTVTFTSSDEKVATVTAEGVVTAVDKGTATITAKAANGKSAECQITVTIPATKVYLNQSFTIKKGQTKTLTATLAPADSTDKITWKSSNTKKVTVDQNGKIKAVAAGSAKITATSDSGKKATCTVTVAAKAVKATKVTIAKTSNTMKVGDVKQLKVTVKPAKTTDAVTFQSSKKAVVSVASNGVLTAKKAGSATITVKAGKKKATIKITVSAPATAIKLNKTKATIKKGKTLKLKATLTPKGCNDTLKFKSSKASVASVDSKGVVKGKKKGTATITVTTGSGKKATCKVTVK